MGINAVAEVKDACVQSSSAVADRSTSVSGLRDEYLPVPAVTYLPGYPTVRTSSPVLEELGESGLSAILNVTHSAAVPSSGAALLEGLLRDEVPQLSSSQASVPVSRPVLDANPPLAEPELDAVFEESVAFSGN